MLRECLTLMSQASLHINESLDFDTVFQGVLDSALALTRAHYGVTVLLYLDNADQIQEFLRSGMTPEAGRPLWDHPNRMRFFEYVSGIQEPLRLRDFHCRALSVGLPEFLPAMTASSVLPFHVAFVRGNQGTGCG